MVADERNVMTIDLLLVLLTTNYGQDGAGLTGVDMYELPYDKT